MNIRECLWMGKQRPALCALLWFGILLVPLESSGQARNSPDSLHQFSESMAELAQRISPAVVQIIVTGYGPVEKEGHNQTALIGRRRVSGSGVIIDPEGYIITNAHVVFGAQKVQVLLTSPTMSGSPESVLESTSRSLNARIVGMDKQIDLALLKVEATGLSTLSFGEYERIRQGEIVLAFGSPEGLENSVTMGVISSVARQPVPETPLIYIQTDAPINPGNSGGPLVDVDGKVLGLNTFILTQGGGNEGIGFAIPSSIVHHVYTQLKQYGHVHRKIVGAAVQPISSGLADALTLPLDHGLIVADVLPGGPAESVGLRIKDIILTVDGNPMQSLPQFESYLLMRDKDEKLKMEVMRGKEKITLLIPVMERRSDEDRLADLVNPENNMIPILGILGITIDERIGPMRENLRINSGVAVAAVTEAAGAEEIGLEAGDVIHSLNGVSIQSVEALRDLLNKIKAGATVVLQVEREGQLQFIEFEI